MSAHEMSILGVSEGEEKMYRHFLRNPDTSTDSIHLLVHTDPGTAKEQLDRLRELGLLRETGPDRWAATDPEAAVGRLMDMRLHDLHQELRKVTRSRHLVDSLLAERTPEAPVPLGVEQLTGLDQIRSRIDDLAFFAREEILSVEPYEALSPENIEHARPLDMRCLRRGVRIRSIVLRAALEHPPTFAYLGELASHGARIRVTDDISERILVYDRRTAVVPVNPDDTACGALLAREEGLISTIIALFERIWSQAEDLPSTSGDEELPALSDVEKRVLEAMCTVGKDEAGARSIGVSVRTYRRHVADLKHVLGASSRAQAALLARERGWI
ncbi:helix-turn-helix transcriptional regulator [Streptomyces sp. NTH33]|uniref:helix-turn-helix transcriptional regulator n=1 Tax=Streptomyces sp. NTH33 TaxID=1735453 RepID=UPI0015E8CFDE|nr:helix-turn-helix transcriptional regulator [Streptomyces sp. NTH33]